MNTETFVAMSIDVQPNKNWFEIWSVEQDGSLKNCMNFYDACLQNSVLWACQCLSQEGARTEDSCVMVHATRNKDGEMVRQIITESPENNRMFNVLNKYRAALKQSIKN